MMQKFDRSLLPPAPDLSFEMNLWAKGIQYIAGIDEAGRGALAGPVCAAAVILPASPALQDMLIGVRDSKEMSPDERQTWAGRIACTVISYGIGFTESGEIDRIGIAPATHLAARRALEDLCLPPQHLLIDYLPQFESPFPHTSLVKGDARCLSIAAASVLAKTARDALMRRLHLDYPAYGFDRHKGYGTQEHRHVLAVLGPTPLHRRSFRYKSLEP